MGKWINIGENGGWSDANRAVTLQTTDENITNTGYVLGLANSEAYVKHAITDNEVWFSCDVAISTASWNNYASLSNPSNPYMTVTDANGKEVHVILPNHGATSYNPKIAYGSSYSSLTTLYETDSVAIQSSSSYKTNFEVHAARNVDGTDRIDVWCDHKLVATYKAVDLWGADLAYVGFRGPNSGSYPKYYTDFSSIIVSTDRRIGYEKFVRLSVSPDTEQTIEAGGTQEYTVTGMPSASEYKEITAVFASVLPVSHDADITQGTFAINGKEIGKVDVSSSSGLAYDLAIALTKPDGTAWTADDIEGKVLTLTVNGAD